MYTVEIYNMANENQENPGDVGVRIIRRDNSPSGTTSTESSAEGSTLLTEALGAKEEYNKEYSDKQESRILWNYDYTEEMNDYLRYNAPNVNINGETLNLVRNSVTKKFSLDTEGYTRADTLTITWREADDYRVKRYHETWIARFYNRDTDKYTSTTDPYAAGLYRTIRVKLGNKLAIRFDNVIPKNVAGLSLGWKESPGIITHSMEYYIESWEWETNAEEIGL